MRLGAGGRPRIGLAWAGRRREPVNHSRDMRLEMFAPLMRLDADIISLQKEVPDHDRPVLESMSRVARLGEQMSDFAETAALMENLDLVITVDSAVAHLAGALGKPVWIMLRYFGEWRWLLDRTDSPWYPSARLFRQKTPGDWAGVVADIARELEKIVVCVEYAPILHYPHFVFAATRKGRHGLTLSKGAAFLDSRPTRRGAAADCRFTPTVLY